jgi:RNA polymerase sigma-70 factor (ECF subfamily)
MEAPLPDETWQTWFRDHGPKLLLCARQWTRSLADAEDVVQEAFVRYWRHQRQLGGPPLPLLLTSIRRAAADRGRREGRRAAREQAVGEDPVEWLEPGDPDADERHRELAAALAALPAAQREVLVLKIWGELTFAEIGVQLELSPHTVASRYRYALAALRERLADPCLTS